MKGDYQERGRTGKYNRKGEYGQSISFTLCGNVTINKASKQIM